MNSNNNSNYISGRAKLASSFGLDDTILAPIETVKPNVSMPYSISSNASQRPSESYSSMHTSKPQYPGRSAQSIAANNTNYSTRRIGHERSTVTTPERKPTFIGSYSPNGSHSASGKVYSSGTAHGAFPGNTRFATSGSSAFKPEVIPEERKDTKKRSHKQSRPSIFQSIYAYCIATDAVPKAVIVCLVIALALTACIPLVGSLSKTSAQNELNSINEQIKSVNHRIAELNEAYLSSIDSNAASMAAVNFGMIRSAQNTPIHP